MSITIFTTPKAFKGKTKVDQYNSIISWKKFVPSSQIILIGNDYGTDVCARELEVEHIKDCQTNDLGTPFLDSIFNIAQSRSNYDLQMYINADIVFTHPLENMIACLKNNISAAQNFLLTGQRHDIDSNLDLEHNDDLNKLKSKISAVEERAKLHGPAGLDYFIFRKNSFILPPFLIGRPCWDNWLLWHCYNQKFMIINATGSLKILHQNHDYSHSKTGGKGRVLGAEWDYNVKVAGGYANQENLRCQTHHLDNNLINPRSIHSRLLYKIYSKIFGRTLLALLRYGRYMLKNRQK